MEDVASTVRLYRQQFLRVSDMHRLHSVWFLRTVFVLIGEIGLFVQKRSVMTNQLEASKIIEYM